MRVARAFRNKQGEYLLVPMSDYDRIDTEADLALNDNGLSFSGKKCRESGHRFQNAGENSTSTVKSSRRPVSMQNERIHLPAVGT